MDSLWLEVAYDTDNQAKVEAFAERMCIRRTGPRFFMRSRKDYVAVLAYWINIMARES